jgi:mannose-6-phosphate isomerase
MNNKSSIFKLQGKVQHYQWGGFDYIPQLLGIENKYHLPFAEYWLGAHDSAPSQLNNGEMLNDFILQHPELLGEKVQNQFGRLPYLLKILDVKDMLSIQVHPNKKSAVTEFEKENNTGTPVNAHNRNYKDDNHKPELMMALSDFWLLHGFRNSAGLKKMMATVPEFNFMLPVFEQKGYKGLYELLMTMDQIKVNEILQPLLNRIIPLYQSATLQKDNPDFWAARAAGIFNKPGKTDRGIFSIYLFNIVHLVKGEAIFQDAGILHAYLEGQNVEIMANSDNVLRGGLTSKHINVTELMKHVIFEAVNPNIIHGTPVNETENFFVTTAPDFELSTILLAANETYLATVLTTEIFLILHGVVEVAAAETKLNCSQGEAFAAFSDTKLNFLATSNAEIYRASVPLKKQ